MANADIVKRLEERIYQLEAEIVASKKTIGSIAREQLFSEKVIDSLPGIFYLYDEEGNLIGWNKNHESLTGFSDEEIIVRNMFDWFCDADKIRVEEAVNKVYDHGDKISIEAGLLIKDGSAIPHLFTGVRMTLEGKKYLLGMGVDLTEQKAAQEALKESEEKYRAIFENAVEGIYQTTVEGKMVNCNPAMASMLGYLSVEEFLASVQDVSRDMYVTPSAREGFIKILERDESVSGYEVEFRHKSGQSIWISLNARGITDQNGQLQLIEGIIHDITKSRRQAEQLREQEAYLRKENTRLRSNIKDRYRFGDIIGKSRSMQQVYEFILKAAATDANTIIYGESGTGKELVARAVHRLSDRKSGRFIPVNCGAIPDNLMESEFFGYSKGAFTGAAADKQGYLDLADGGTLFLDELGEIDHGLQVKLLRVLDGYGYTPVGGGRPRHSNVRIIGATNRDLPKMVKRGRMREDFFYRIHIIPIQLPPLRERKEDIPLLIEHFLRSSVDGDIATALPGDMIEKMMHHQWPGNVRELQNVLQRYRSLNQFDLPQQATPTQHSANGRAQEVSAVSGTGYHATMAEFEKQLLVSALEQHQWRREDAARAMGLPLRTFYRKLQQHCLVRHKKCQK